MSDQMPGRRDDAGRLLVLDASKINDVPWEPMRNLVGVEHKVLWRSGNVVFGLIRVAPGADKPMHVHYNAEHHIWIVAGEGTMIGHRVPAGSYLYIPPGVEHDVTDVGPQGCTFFYTYRPTVAPSPESPAEQGAAVAPV